MKDHASIGIAIVSAAMSRAEWMDLLQSEDFHYYPGMADIPAESRYRLLLLADEQEGLPALPGPDRAEYWLVSCTQTTLSVLADGDPRVGRCCGWPGWWAHKSWEIAVAADEAWEAISQQLLVLGRTAIRVPDTPGLVAPATLARIIHEAVCLWQDGVATREDIDLAMTLGTNYPLGPFAWAEAIGWPRVNALLHAIAAAEGDLTPHPAIPDMVGN